MRCGWTLATVCLLAGLLWPAERVDAQGRPCAVTGGEFRNPERVRIAGYDGDAMEPFLSRDGRLLFFNNRNEAPSNTNLHWAERVSDLEYRYRGEIRGVNTADLEAVASMDRQGRFFFVSDRSYKQTASTIYWAKFRDGAVEDVALAPGVSVGRAGVVNFDAEISADGNTLYFVESQFGWFGGPKSARIVVARRTGDHFRRDPAGDAMLRSVNGATLTYAPAVSESECEIFWTQVGRDGPAIYTASRRNTGEPFGAAARVTAITGFAEAPTVAPGDRALLFHRRDAGKMVLYRVTRP